MQILYSAAHGDPNGANVPLGGGGAVCRQLLREWSRTRPFEIRLLEPSILGSGAPDARTLVGYSEGEYAAFCHRFEAAVTAEILRHDPALTRVLINDISEAPDCARLHAAGFGLYTIYHVDVVAYVARMYARGLVSPANLIRAYHWLGPAFPRVARLVFEKQEQSLRLSRRVIVPSAGMRDLLLECYPGTPAERIRVLPWGHWREEEETAFPVFRVREELGIGANQPVLLTLSRISPEKGQHLLLEAMSDWERRRDYPAAGVVVILCGGPAYMAGERYHRRLRSLAARLTRTRVLFPGHITGERKQALLAAADLYVFPSLHESYGLTLVEALASGLPAVCLDHHGAREVMRPEFGAVAPRAALLDALCRLIGDPVRRRSCARAARQWARAQTFSRSAATLAEWLLE